MSFKTISLSLMAMLVIVFVFISIISDDSVEGKNQNGGDKKRGSSDEKMMNDMKRPSSSHMNEFSHDEVRVGGKRFKLFEKKHLNHKKATSFCKKKDGRLAQAMNLEEMRRLQMLLMRARTVGDDMWIGADKKEWKKHSLKMQRKPNFGPDPMLFGGGPTEMCPALSVSTRSLAPVMCTKELAFICEFEEGKKKSTKSQAASSTKSKTTKSPSKSSSGGKKATNKVKRSKAKIEMKRRKREVVIQGPNPSISAPATTTTTTSKGDDDDASDEDDDDDNSMETTETYVTENSVSAAAEHKIGFVPHVEHLLVPENNNNNNVGATSEIYTDNNIENMEKLVTDRSDTNNNNNNNPPRSIHQVKVSTKIIIDIEDNSNGNILKSSATTNSRTTTTLDPDQLLMDMIDEQTMNLTAIEMEAEAESSSSSPTVTKLFDKSNNKGKLQKISEPIEDNDLSFVSDDSVSASSRLVSGTTDDPADDDDEFSSKLMRERSSVGMKEDINATLSVSTSPGMVEEDVEISYNSTDTATATTAGNEDSSGGGSMSPSSSTPAVPFSSTIIGTTVIEVSIEVDDIINNDDNNNKRAMRNASQSIEASNSSSSSTRAENSTVDILEAEDEQQGVNYNNGTTDKTTTVVMHSSSTINETDATEPSITNIKSKPVLVVTQLPVLINGTIITEDFEGSSSNFSSTEQQETTASGFYEPTPSPPQ